MRSQGRDREGIEKQSGESWDRIIAPKDDDLGQLVDMMRNMRECGLFDGE